uniref:Uncharacterized protein n=1 Tax=Papio anubis TaxID=9555 RepID=A0A8I5P3U6_PAPAN
AEIRPLRSSLGGRARLRLKKKKKKKKKKRKRRSVLVPGRGVRWLQAVGGPERLRGSVPGSHRGWRGARRAGPGARGSLCGAGRSHTRSNIDWGAGEAVKQARLGGVTHPDSCRLIFFFLWDGVSPCCPGWRAVARSRLAATSAPGLKRFSRLSFAGITGTRQQARLTFVFLVETGFHHIGQAGLKLLTSGDPPARPPKVLGLQAPPPRPANFLYF